MTMGNSTRWRKLMEWMRYLQENGLANKLNFEWLQEKVGEIKKGGATTTKKSRGDR